MRWIVWILVSSPFLLAVGAMVLNRPPLFQEPGLLPRLKIYLSRNVAQTAEDHSHPELRTPVFDVEEKVLREQVTACMHLLDWRNVHEQDGVIHAEVVTTLLRFTDDVEARWQPVAGGMALQLRSASRVGKADLAANQRHLMELLGCLRASIG